MAVTYEWAVESALQTRTQDGLSDVVFSCFWQCDAQEVDSGTTYTATTAGEISLNTDNLDPATFTAFADLTETQVLGWAKAQIDANAAEGQGITCVEWEEGLARNIAKQINPPTQTLRAPWSPNESSDS